VTDGEWSMLRMRADLCVRLVDHLVHSVVVEPPPGVGRAEAIEEIVRIARRCLHDESPGLIGAHPLPSTPDPADRASMGTGLSRGPVPQ
jgi:hypothetical protein